MKPLLSVVVTVGRDEPRLAELLRQVDETCAACGHRCEVLLAAWGDGREAAKAAASRSLDACGGQARALLLAGAGGAAPALAAGLRRAAGELVILLDSRATLRPADLLAALARLADGAELVVGRRPCGVGDRLRRRATDLLLGAPGSPDPRGLVVIAREAARALPLYGNLHLLLPAVARHWGVAVAEVALAPAPGASTPAAAPGVGDLLAAFFLLRFARLPLRFFGPIGVLLLLLGVAADGLLVYQKLAHGQAMSDRPLLLLGTLLLVLGIQALSLGLVAELIVFIHARKLRDYRIGGEWTGAAEDPWEDEAGDRAAAPQRAGAAE